MIRKQKLEELKSLIEEVKFTSMRVVDAKGGFIKGIPYDVTLKNGMTIRREKLIKGETDGSAAIILPLTTNGEILLTIEPRVFTKRGVGISLPAGYINPNEAPKHAALRELKEETGYTCNKVIDLGGFYQDMGISSAYNRLFLGIDAEKTTEPNFDKDEIVLPFICTYEEAQELIKLGYIEGCNALITLERAKSDIKRLKMLK